MEEQEALAYNVSTYIKASKFRVEEQEALVSPLTRHPRRAMAWAAVEHLASESTSTVYYFRLSPLPRPLLSQTERGASTLLEG